MSTGTTQKKKLKVPIKLVFGLVTAASVLAVLLYPFETTVVPEWKVRVVDESGNLMIGMAVKEGWEHSSIESHRHEQDLTTDDEGRVTFPRRTIRANLLWRVGGAAVVAIVPHQQSGPHFFLYALGPYSTLTGTDYLPNNPLPGTIVVRRLNATKP
jgi:hypothetical protein